MVCGTVIKWESGEASGSWRSLACIFPPWRTSAQPFGPHLHPNPITCEPLNAHLSGIWGSLRISSRLGWLSFTVRSVYLVSNTRTTYLKTSVTSFTFASYDSIFPLFFFLIKEGKLPVEYTTLWYAWELLIYINLPTFRTLYNWIKPITLRFITRAQRLLTSVSIYFLTPNSFLLHHIAEIAMTTEDNPSRLIVNLVQSRCKE